MAILDNYDTSDLDEETLAALGGVPETTSTEDSDSEGLSSDLNVSLDTIDADSLSALLGDSSEDSSTEIETGLPSIEEVEPYEYESPEVTEANVPGGIISPAQGGTAASYQTPEKYVPGENELMSGRLDEFLDENSPLMQRAAKKGEREAQAKGLLDSSLASQYSMGAVMDQAIPIAQQEAGAFHEAGMAEYQGKTQAALANLDYENQASLQSLQATLESQLSRQGTVQEDYLQQRKSAFQGLVSSGLSAQEARQRIQEIEKQGMVNSDLSAQDAQQQLKLDEQQQAAETYRTELQIEAEEGMAWNELTAAEKEVAMNKMNDLGLMYQEAVGNIQMQPELDEDAKTVLLEQQKEIYQANMQVVADMYGIELSWYNPNETGTTETTEEPNETEEPGEIDFGNYSESDVVGYIGQYEDAGYTSSEIVDALSSWGISLTEEYVNENLSGTTTEETTTEEGTPAEELIEEPTEETTTTEEPEETPEESTTEEPEESETEYRGMTTIEDVFNENDGSYSDAAAYMNENYPDVLGDDVSWTDTFIKYIRVVNGYEDGTLTEDEKNFLEETYPDYSFDDSVFEETTTGETTEDTGETSESSDEGLLQPGEVDSENDFGDYSEYAVQQGITGLANAGYTADEIVDYFDVYYEATVTEDYVNEIIAKINNPTGTPR